MLKTKHTVKAVGISSIEIIIVLLILSTTWLLTIGTNHIYTQKHQVLAVREMQSILLYTKLLTLLRQENLTICPSAQTNHCASHWNKPYWQISKQKHQNNDLWFIKRQQRGFWRFNRGNKLNFQKQPWFKQNNGRFQYSSHDNSCTAEIRISRNAMIHSTDNCHRLSATNKPMR